MDKNINIDHKLIEYIFSHTNNLHPIQEELLKYNYKGFELGKLATSSIIWIKRTPLFDKKDIGYFKKIIKDSIGLIDYFEGLNLKDYSAVLVFNGASFPESILYEFCNVPVSLYIGSVIE